MIVLGALLIALGVGSLFDFNVWPLILIAAGIAYVLSAVSRRGRSSVWALPSCCYPEFWVGREPERNLAPAEDRPEP